MLRWSTPHPGLAEANVEKQEDEVKHARLEARMQEKKMNIGEQHEKWSILRAFSGFLVGNGAKSLWISWVNAR